MNLNSPSVGTLKTRAHTTAGARLVSWALGIFIMLLPQLSLAQRPNQVLSQGQAPTEFDSASRISGFELRRLDPGIELWIESSAALELVGMEIKQPNRIVLQLPRHRAPNHLVEGSFEGDLISNGTVTVQETGRGPLTKVSFSVWPGSQHTISVEGSVLRFKLRPADFEPVVASDLDQVKSEAGVLRSDLRKSEAARRKLTAALTAASAKNETLQRRFDQLEDRRRSLQAGLSSALADFTQLEQALKQVHAPEPLDDVQLVATYENKIERLEAALSDYATARYNLANQLDAMTSERDFLTEQVARLRSDRSDRQESVDPDRPAQPTGNEEPAPTVAASFNGSTLLPTNIRAEPEGSATPLALLASGIEVTVLEVEEEWVRIQWEDQIGWIPREDLLLPEKQ